MDIILLLTILLSLFGVRFYGKKYNEVYMEQKQTSAINGVFVLFVFYRHFAQYIDLKPYPVFSKINSSLGQLIVTTFLFYSGYGVMVSLIHKKNYERKLPKKVLLLWLEFSAALLLFLAANSFVDKEYDFKTTFLSFLGWETIGNSNWYVVAILSLYLFSYLSCIISNKMKLRASQKRIGKLLTVPQLRREEHFFYLISVSIIAFLCGVFIVVMKLAGKPAYTYNTILLFPAGSLFALYKEKLTIWLKKTPVHYYGSLALCTAFFFFFYKLRGLFVFYEGHVLLFIAVLLLLSMKFKVGNPVLRFLSLYTYELYLLQRLPMRLFQKHITNAYLYFLACFAVTFCLSVVFRKGVQLLSQRKSRHLPNH